MRKKEKENNPWEVREPWYCRLAEHLPDINPWVTTAIASAALVFAIVALVIRLMKM